MKKKLIRILALVMLLSLCFGNAAYAADEPEIVSAYRVGDTMYSFVEYGEEDEKLKLSSSEFGGKTAETEVFHEGDATALYVVMYDISYSMREFGEDAEVYLKAVFANKKFNSRLIIVPYNEDIYTEDAFDSAAFEDEAEFEEALADYFGSIEYSNADNYSVICLMELLDALDNNLPAQPGDLANVIVMTDNFDDFRAEPEILEEASYALSLGSEFANAHFGLLPPPQLANV